MPILNELKQIPPNVKAYRLMLQLFKENKDLTDIIDTSKTIRQAKKRLKTWALEILSENKQANAYYLRKKIGKSQLDKLVDRLSFRRWRTALGQV